MDQEQEQDTAEPAVFNGYPQIVLCKASGGRRLDCVIVDLSPLRKQNKGTKKDSNDASLLFLYKWKQQIFSAAATAGMELRKDYLEDNCETLLWSNTTTAATMVD